MAVQYLDSGNDEGTVLGQSSASLVGFWGATPVNQPANIADAVAITGGEAPSEAEYNLLVTKINAIIAALEEAGITAAS